MDLKYISNIIAIDEEQSISKAAEKLFLTQSALNQQLLSLEKELGIKLFERRQRKMVATFSGKVYLEAARKMIEMKRETYKIIYDVSKQQKGEIAICFTPERGAQMFAYIFPLFHKKYPNITFKIYEARGVKAEQLLLKKNTTISLLAHTEKMENPLLTYIRKGKENVVLGLPKTHKLAYLAGENSHILLPPIDIQLLKDDLFIMPSHETLSRQLVDQVFAISGFKPKILFELSMTATIVNMVHQQICPAFFPQSYVEEDAPVVYFSVEPKIEWILSVVYNKDSYLSEAERYLVELLKEMMTQYYMFKDKSSL